MANIRTMLDGLRNALTGQGTGADARRGNSYTPTCMTQQEIDAAYRGSGMMRKIIDIPALDMVREWRNWQAESNQIKLLENEERRLDLRGKIRMAETLRGLGGGAIILGVPGDQQLPVNLRAIGKKGLAFIHVVSRWHLTLGDQVTDANDPLFGGPKNFKMQTSLGEQTFHPSRVVCFKGDPLPLLQTMGWEEQFWGESRVARVLDAVQNSDTAQGAFASLITKSRNVIIGIPGLTDIVSEPEGEAAIGKRLATMALGEGMYHATLRDAGDGTPGAGETIDHRQVTWTGIPDIMMAFATFMSAVSDIPATRLLGKSPDGMNATGKGDSDNWHKTVRAKQTLELGPCMDQIDAALIPSALGTVPTDEDGKAAEIWYEWAPLDTPSEKDEADTFYVTMQAVEKAQATGAIPEEAFVKGFQNLMTERGWMPGLEGALAEIPEDERFGLNPEPDDTDPSALTQENGNGGDPDLAGGGKPTQRRPARRAANDGKPKPKDA